MKTIHQCHMKLSSELEIIHSVYVYIQKHVSSLFLCIYTHNIILKWGFDYGNYSGNPGPKCSIFENISFR